MTNSIVTVNVTQTVAPTPSKLQRMGALISQGGTTLTAGSYEFLTELADLTGILSPALPIGALAWSSNTVTVTLPTGTLSTATYDPTTGLLTITLASSISGLTSGQTVVISGMSGTGAYASLNGTYVAASGTSPTTLIVQALTGLTLTITGGNIALSHGITTGEAFITTIASAAPAGYNGTYFATVTSATQFTYALTTGPGTATTLGTYTGRNTGELNAMATTFFSQGSSQGVYVLELGAGEPTAGVAELSSFMTANPNYFYAYLVPRSWDVNTSFLALLAEYESTTAKTYFFVTTTISTYTRYLATMKDVYAFVEAPTVGVTEFTAASAFQVRLKYNPSSSNKVTPYAFSYLYDVTQYPTKGNASLITSLKNASINYVGTGAEGGISTDMLLWGTSLDGRDGIYWYSIDWAQINVDLDISNTIINGSNNPVNPLYYNQDGINRLQDTAVSTMNSAISYGLATGSVVRTQLTSEELDAGLDAGTFSNQIVVNAVPFISYLTENPSDYKTGTYSGLSVIYIPTRGFIQIIFNINVTDFVATS